MHPERCAKCGSTDVRKLYDRNKNVVTKTCSSCKYSWASAALDAGQGSDEKLFKLGR